MLKQEKIFEDNVTKLTKIISQLEDEDLPLSLKEITRYIKDGQNISKICYRILERVGGQLSVILDEKGDIKPLCKYYLSTEMRQINEEITEEIIGE